MPLDAGERDDRAHRVPEQDPRHAGVRLLDQEVHLTEVRHDGVDAARAEPADAAALRRPAVTAEVHRVDGEPPAGQRRRQAAVARRVLGRAVDDLDGPPDYAVRQAAEKMQPRAVGTLQQPRFAGRGGHRGSSPAVGVRPGGPVPGRTVERVSWPSCGPSSWVRPPSRSGTPVRPSQRYAPTSVHLSGTPGDLPHLRAHSTESTSGRLPHEAVPDPEVPGREFLEHLRRRPQIMVRQVAVHAFEGWSHRLPELRRLVPPGPPRSRGWRAGGPRRGRFQP